MFFLYDENEYLRRKKKHKEECNFGVYKHVENLHNTFGNIWFINEKKKNKFLNFQNFREEEIFFLNENSEFIHQGNTVLVRIFDGFHTHTNTELNKLVFFRRKKWTTINHFLLLLLMMFVSKNNKGKFFFIFFKFIKTSLSLKGDKTVKLTDSFFLAIPCWRPNLASLFQFFYNHPNISSSNKKRKRHHPVSYFFSWIMLFYIENHCPKKTFINFFLYYSW